MLFVALSITISMPLAFAAISDSSNLYCSDGKVLVYRLNSDKYACLNPPSAEKWYKSGIAEPVEQMPVKESVIYKITRTSIKLILYSRYKIVA